MWVLSRLMIGVTNTLQSHRNNRSVMERHTLEPMRKYTLCETTEDANH